MKIPKNKKLSDIASIHEDYYGHHFDDELCGRLDLIICDCVVTDGLSYKDKARRIKNLAEYLDKCSNFFEYLSEKGKYRGATLED